MKNGICAKCNAENVHVAPSSRTGVSVPVSGVFSVGAFTNFYFCGECGHVEIFVEKKEDLQKAVASWPKVPVTK